MPKLVFCLLLLLGSACSSGVIVHDETRASELIVDFLQALKTEEGIKLSYAWTDDRYKEQVSWQDFRRSVARTRNRNQRADISLIGFEIIGPVEAMAVYARSDLDEGHLYYRFILSGTKTKDYYLLEWQVDDTEFKRESGYRPYPTPAVVAGV